MTAAFIVEGQMEQKIVQRLAPNSPVVLLGANGKSVSMGAISRRIGTLYRQFGNRFHPVHILFDREQRSTNCEDLIAELRDLLTEESVPLDQTTISIADRKIETWILYSVDQNGDQFNCCSCSSRDEYEGKLAISELSRRLGRKGLTYRKTTTGVKLFCSIDQHKLTALSKSFNSLAEAFNTT